MDYSSAKTDALANWFGADLIDTVTYEGSDISAHVEYEENLDETNLGETVMAKAVITIKRSDIAAPAYRDTVIIGSDTWRVRNILEGDAYTWRLALYRDERPII